MPDEKPREIVDRDTLRPDRTQFRPGNTAAAKPKWSTKRLASFADELRTFRTLIGYTYSKMGRALGVSGQYIKLLERTERQPSSELVRTFHRLKAKAIQQEIKLRSEDVEHIAELWSHVLGHRFKCPECTKEVRRHKRAKGLEYWWGTKNQKYCPDHAGRRKPKSRRQRKP
jgi:transcriptional regulator with XRE-family HTH domain